ncbi:MAG TPA: NAD(P)H-dependent oxidoreductase [Gammaproteobacteria bacterium]|nr:NAD(P)H-dependent oxidoreductase [Gammaproteobacteria bacterium]
MKKQAHIIIAHPNKQSFNYGLKSLAEEQLLQKGFEVVTSDLYELHAENHPAVGPFQFSYSPENIQKIKLEQAKIKTSQLTFVQFPLYWYTVPGLLKNYMDTVWELDFAFGLPDKVFQKSPLADGRQVLLSVTTQTPREKYDHGEIRGPIENLLHPIELAFKFIGFEILPAFVTYNIEGKSPGALEPTKKEFIEHINKILK